MKKGITIITLAVMIVIMIIITTTVTITGAKTINNSKKIKFASELVVVKEAIEDYALLNAGELPINEQQIQISSELESMLSNTGNNYIFYEVNMSLLKNIETIYGRGIYGTDDMYLYDPLNKFLCYNKGVVAGKTYYFLDNELKSIINLNDDIKVRDGIIFEKTPNTEEYINQEITVTVKIPDSYTNVTVLSQDSVVSTYTQEEHYYVYTVTKSSNFNVVVNYTKEEQTLRQVYLVSNFDNTVPEIEDIKDEDIELITADGETKKSIKLSVTDNLSGIGKIMYEVGDYEDIDESYFDTRGYNVYNNNVIVDRTVDKITIYAVDRAKNYSLRNFDLRSVTSTDDYVKYGLILHYDGINNTGSGHSATATLWKDLSGHGNDGILKGGQWLRNSLKFDDSFVDIGIKNYENITLEIVVSHDSLSSGEVDYIDNFEGCGYGITYNSSHSLKNEMWIYNSNNNWIKVTSNTNVELDKKYSLSGSYDGHTLYLYDNGVKYYNSHEGTIKHKSNIPIFIGANPSSDGKNGSEFLNGKVYSVRIYNRALTEEEVIQNYNVDKARFGI